MKTSGTNVLGFDPGLAKVGWAIVTFWPDRGDVIQLGTLTTEKTPTRHGVLVASDDIRRTMAILSSLDRIIAEHKPVAMCVELPGAAKGYRAASALGIAKGLVAAVAHCYSLPLAECTPLDLKKATTGSRSATKEAVQLALAAKWTSAASAFAAFSKSYRGKKTATHGAHTWGTDKVEHAADALGAVETCLDSQVIRMARRMAS